MNPARHFAASLLTFAFATLPACSKQDAPRPHPTPALAPDEVVKTVMMALKDNDHPAPNSGIATAFDFASPQNKTQTGPLERFIPMVKSPGYRPMIGFVDIEYLPVLVHDDEAQEVVRIKAADQQNATYVFMLHKQRDGVFKDCWMTDGVMRLKEAAPATQPEPVEPKKPSTTV